MGNPHYRIMTLDCVCSFSFYQVFLFTNAKWVQISSITYWQQMVEVFVSCGYQLFCFPFYTGYYFAFTNH